MCALLARLPAAADRRHAEATSTSSLHAHFMHLEKRDFKKTTLKNGERDRA